MFKGSRRSNFSSVLNKPVVIHRVSKPQHIAKDEILQFLDEFITTKESLIESNITQTSINGESTMDGMINIDTNLSSALSQLKRIQRDFKGLPPTSSLMLENNYNNKITVTTNGKDNNDQETHEDDDTTDSKITKSATGGTKMKFDD